MRNWPHTLGVTAALIALLGLAGWVSRPDLHERVRLMSPGAIIPWITASDSVSMTGATKTTPSSAAPCNQADLDAWQMPTPPDVASRHVTLYSDRVGTKRVAQGEMLAPGVVVDSVTATQITLRCVGASTSNASRQLSTTRSGSLEVSSAGHVTRSTLTRLPAPLGN